MPLELLTRKDLLEFKIDLFNELKKLLSKPQEDQKRYLKSREVLQILRISPGTLQNLRQNKTLPYRQMGRILYYDPEDVAILFKRRGV